MPSKKQVSNAFASGPADALTNAASALNCFSENALAPRAKNGVKSISTA